MKLKLGDYISKNCKDYINDQLILLFIIIIIIIIIIFLFIIIRGGVTGHAALCIYVRYPCTFCLCFLS